MSRCIERAHLFGDGELQGAEAAAYEAHLASCSVCQEELETILLLRARMRDLPVQWRAGTVTTRRRQVILVGGVGLAAAATLLVFFLIRQPSGDRSMLARAQVVERGFDRLTEGGHRPILERLTYAAADRYRPPPRVLRAERTAAAAPVDTVEFLRQRGQAHGLLALWLWAGDTHEAAKVAHGTATDLDVENDVAVLALRRAQLEEALARLDGVLRRDPAHAQALWNRALVHERRDRIPDAIRDWRTVAARGEPGWADEARQRADRLEATSAPPSGNSPR
jgi:cellulose synthase operon protein C